MRELPPVSLDDFAPPWGASEYAWGAPVTHDGAYWQDHQYYVEILGWFYHDYLGTHLFVQVWDYAQQDDPDQRWQYMLLLHRPTRRTDGGGLIVDTGWEWTIRCEYEGREDHLGPSFVEVGRDVDLWLEAPDVLRFIIE